MFILGSFFSNSYLTVVPKLFLYKNLKMVEIIPYLYLLAVTFFNILERWTNQLDTMRDLDRPQVHIRLHTDVNVFDKLRVDDYSSARQLQLNHNDWSTAWPFQTMEWMRISDSLI